MGYFNPPKTHEEREADLVRQIEVYKNRARRWETLYSTASREVREFRCQIEKLQARAERMESRFLPVNDLLIRKRVALGLTQKEVAVLLGVTATTISRWEQQCALSLEKVVAYATALLDYEPKETDDEKEEEVT